MPFLSWIKGCSKENRHSKVDYKSKLEHKLLHAKQTPEPVFDLSECGLKQVPSEVYSWCKVCLKEALLLQDNSLTSLDGGDHLKDLANITVLDLRNNQLRHVTPEISYLAKLQILYLNNNCLKTLPKTMDQLKNLKTLNISYNKFSVFPETLCCMQWLQSIDVSNNNIRKLPPKLTNVRTLDTLLFNENNIEYPPAEVCEKGLEAIMRFLCSECNIDYIPPSKAIVVVENSAKTSVDGANRNSQLLSELQDFWKDFEKKKEKKRQRHLEMELNLQEQQMNQTKMIADLQAKRSKLLDDVSKGQHKLEEELMQAQKKKDQERQNLILELVQMEEHSNNIIEELLTLAERSKNLELLLEAERQEREEFEELFLKQKEAAEELRQKDVLQNMTKMLMEEEHFKSQYKYKLETAKNFNEENNGLNENLQEILAKKNQDHQDLITNMLNEEEMQKKAFQALMNARDTDSLLIRDNIYLIQDELSKLTMLELKQKNLRIEFEMDLLEQKRAILTQLLLQYMEQRKTRQEELKRRLLEMEKQKQADQENYWLIQYQRLMDHKPAHLVKLETNMDEQVRNVLIEAGAEEYIPLFARNGVSYEDLCSADFDKLRKLGINNPRAVAAITSIIHGSEDEITENQDTVPTADSLDTPSAPSVNTHNEVECVICLDKRCCMLYLNCGHVCCCEDCGLELDACPLCRGQIQQKIHLKYPD